MFEVEFRADSTKNEVRPKSWTKTLGVYITLRQPFHLTAKIGEISPKI